MQNDIDTWYLESMFSRFRLAAHLVDCIDDASIADELAKSVDEICHRLAALLGKPYGQQATEEAAGSQGTEEPTKDDKSDGCSRVEIHGSRVMRPRISIGCTKTVA